MEELGTEGDDDTDSQGVGLATGRNTRFVSDSLQFTGVDMGDRTRGTSRRGYIRGSEQDDEDDEDDEEEDSSSEDDDYEDELAQLSPAQREKALVQMALRRIERARAQGRTDVKLSQAELGALDRRRKRMEEEAERKRKAAERKKRREPRIAVPLEHLEPITRKKKSIQGPPVSLPLPPRQDSLPRQVSSTSTLGDGSDRQGYPPMGYFAPPAAPRSRPQSRTSSAQRPPSRRADQRPTPFEYMQQPPSAGRHASDSADGPMGPLEEPWIPSISPTASPPGRAVLDPFQFQTGGPRAPKAAGGMSASRRHASGPADMPYVARRPVAAPTAPRRSQQPPSDEETSEEESSEEEEEDEDEEEEEEESSSDDIGSGAQIRQPPRRRRPEVIVVEDPEPEPEPEPEPVRKTAPASRRPAGGKRRRK